MKIAFWKGKYEHHKHERKLLKVIIIDMKASYERIEKELFVYQKKYEHAKEDDAEDDAKIAYWKAKYEHHKYERKQLKILMISIREELSMRERERDEWSVKYNSVHIEFNSY